MDISQRNLLELAMSSLPTGLFICDRDGIIRFINDAYANYLRVRPEDAMGRHITDFIPDSGIPAVIASGEPELGAWRSIQGSERKILVNRIPLRDQDGHVIGAFSLTLFDTPEQMQALLQRVDFLDKKVNSYARRIKSALRASHTINSILGNSPAITAFKSYLLRYARTESPVLILGATGTGKELAASAIHMASNRPDGPFVSINCAAIPKELFESEVFGYVPGAFSGAHKDGKIGQIELADQGTLFLDEVGDLPLHAQVKLLRVLEEKTLSRLGSSQPRAVDFRLVAATNRDLKKMIAAGTFREDLYYRINPMTLNLPPLSERVEDIPLIVRDVLNRMGGERVRRHERAHALSVARQHPRTAQRAHPGPEPVPGQSDHADGSALRTSPAGRHGIGGHGRETPVRRQEQRSANHPPRPRRSPLERRQDGPRPGHLPGQHV